MGVGSQLTYDYEGSSRVFDLYNKCNKCVAIF